MLVHLFALLRLTRVRTTRQAIYTGLALGVAMYGPQLGFFWTIFGAGAVALWLVLAFWIALFVVTVRQCRICFGDNASACLAPVLWLGFDFFRGELYYLRFTWLNVGYAFSDAPLLLRIFGTYGLGFVLMAMAAVADRLLIARAVTTLAAMTAALGLTVNVPLLHSTKPVTPPGSVVRVAGTQLEFPSEIEAISALEDLRRGSPETDLFVLSEYTFDGPVPERVRAWCRRNKKFLVAGGKDELPDGRFCNTAFVIDTNGDLIFEQVKAVPIQFFKDGLPASSQALWHSPWGDLGICICYDLSYTRVTDVLVRAGAQALIVPTMDVQGWGEHQHRLHSRVAPTRAAEYGVPIFRVASSGISQLVGGDALLRASAPFAKENAEIKGLLPLASQGRLPWDRWAARGAVAITGVTVVCLALGALLRRRIARQRV